MEQSPLATAHICWQLEKSYHNFNFILSALNNFSWSKTLLFNKYYSDYLPQFLVQTTLVVEQNCESRVIRTENNAFMFRNMAEA